MKNLQVLMKKTMLKIKALNDKKAEEEALMANIKKEFSYDTFVKIENNDITVVVKTDKHDKTLANNIMRFIQKEYEYHKNISVKFVK